MKKQLAKLALTAALGLALTLLACEDKEKKQTPAETQTAEPAAAETQQPSQEAAAPPPTTLTDPRDSKTYKTVKIGNQTWMAENLNFEAKGSKCYGEGSEVIIEKGGEATTETGEVYDREDTFITLSNAEIKANCEKYGRLYDWETAIKACPSGWHLPSKEEWQTLVNFAGGDEIAGEKLKAKSGWQKSGNGTDNYEFSALPGGCRNENGVFDEVGYYGNWWSTDNYNGCWRMFYSAKSIYNCNFDKSNLHSVRCIQN